VNRAFDDGRDPDARAGAGVLVKLGAVLGMFWKQPESETWSPEILALVAEREAARKARDWARADAARKELAGLGVVVEDSPKGSKIRRV
jgi:cysteinyl-tRNA synthetase